MNYPRTVLTSALLALFALVGCAGKGANKTGLPSGHIKLTRGDGTAKIVKFVVYSQTTTDDKDEGNGVRVVITRNADVVADYGPFHHSLKFPNGDFRGFEIAPLTGYSESDGAKSVLAVTMTGDDGNWEAAFSVVGVRADGTGVELLQQTGSVHFEGGHNDTHRFQMK
jgi:hypothetical protein